MEYIVIMDSKEFQTFDRYGHAADFITWDLCGLWRDEDQEECERLWGILKEQGYITYNGHRIELKEKRA